MTINSCHHYCLQTADICICTWWTLVWYKSTVAVRGLYQYRYRDNKIAQHSRIPWKLQLSAKTSAPLGVEPFKLYLPSCHYLVVLSLLPKKEYECFCPIFQSRMGWYFPYCLVLKANFQNITINFDTPTHQLCFIFRQHFTYYVCESTGLSWLSTIHWAFERDQGPQLKVYGRLPITHNPSANFSFTGVFKEYGQLQVR